jgi:hypothetical protein
MMANPMKFSGLRLFRVPVVVALAASLVASACWRSPEETSETVGASSIAPWSKPAPAAVSGVAQIAERAAFAPPSTAENMGRNFQGRMEFKVSVAGQPDRTLRYMSQGNASRLQIDRAREPIDLLFLDDRLYELDHVAKSYRVIELSKVAEETSEPTKQVRLRQPEPGAPVERKMVEGVVCDDWKISEGGVRIEACVAGLPGSFNVDKFETVTKLDVPGWLEKLLAEDSLPVSVTARDGEGKVIYSVQLQSYVAGPVDVENLSVPANYKRS